MDLFKRYHEIAEADAEWFRCLEVLYNRLYDFDAGHTQQPHSIYSAYADAADAAVAVVKASVYIDTEMAVNVLLPASRMCRDNKVVMGVYATRETERALFTMLAPSRAEAIEIVVNLMHVRHFDDRYAEILKDVLHASEAEIAAARAATA